MAAGSLAAPGSPLGPCEGKCKHVDCAATRRMATAGCVRCRKPIGYEVDFFVDDDGQAHASCVYEALEQAVEKL